MTTDVYVCFAYVPPNTSPYYRTNDQGFFESIERGIETYAGSGYISLIGDFNARCGKKNDYFRENDSFLRYADFQCNSYEEKDFPVRFTSDNTLNESGNRLLDLCAASVYALLMVALGMTRVLGLVLFCLVWAQA